MIALYKKLTKSVYNWDMASKSHTTLPSLTFKYEPLVEVVAGIQFAKLEQFKAPYLDSVWQAFGKKQYPKCQEMDLLPKITAEPTISVGFVSASELPRIWFLSKDDTKLIQFQRDRFLYNWRKIDGAKDNTYPRYKTVIANFMGHYEQLEKSLQHLKVEVPNVEMLELTYINIIPAEHIKGLNNIGDAFRDMAWHKGKRFLPAPNKLNVFWQFQIPATKALMNVHLVTAQRIQDGKPVIKLEISVHGQSVDKTAGSMKRWFDISHDWIINTFDDITTPAMHKLWGKII